MICLIEYLHSQFKVRMVLYEKKGNDRIFWDWKDTMHTIKEGEAVPDDFMLEMPIAFFDAIVKAIQDQGIKRDNEYTLEGELKATKFHLKDMRQLLKLKNDVN